MKEYRARPGSRITDRDAQIIGPVLDELAEQNEGEIVAEQVVEAAQAESSPLHRYFEWDDSIAGHKYRLYESRRIIGSIHVKVMVNEEETEIRNFFNVRGATKKVDPVTAGLEADEEPEETGRRFVVLDRVRSEEELLEEVIQKAEREVRAWAARYRLYQHLAPFRERFAPLFELAGQAGR